MPAPGMPVSERATKKYAEAEALAAHVAQSDLETIRVVFPDQHGILRGKTIVASALPSVLKNGLAVPSTLLLKDTSHRTAFPVWSDDPGLSGPLRGAADIVLRTDPSSLTPVPMSPHSAWLFARPVFRDGAEIPFAPETILARAEAALAAQGLTACFGLEVEFNVFAIEDPALAHVQTTMPTTPPRTRALTPGYQFLTETLYAGAEPLLDDIRRAAQSMGMGLRSIEIEMGPSQFEVTFEPGAPMAQARTMVLFRTLVKELCATKGLHASFMPKPRLDNVAANGWHIHQSLQDEGGANTFTPGPDGALTPHARGWLAGLLEHAEVSSLFTSPTVNGYKRYQPYQLAPNRIAWGQDNRGAMLRALMIPGDPAARIENRAPDSAANPYLAFAAQIVSGLDGLTGGLTPPPPTTRPYDGADRPLPAHLGAAIDAFEGSRVFRAALGDETVDYFTHLKRFEWDRYLVAISEWEQAEYFSLF